MCEFCLKHGEGKKWYLQAKNYAEDLAADVRRREMIRGMFQAVAQVPERIEKLNELDGAPGFVRRMIAWRSTARAKKIHFGQVVPIEEIAEILGFVNTIVRVQCICRNFTVGGEQRYCYGVSMGPNGGAMREIFEGLDSSFLAGPDGTGLEIVDKAEALRSMQEWEKRGLCHTVWTFVTPFIGGICNCDRADCLAMRSTIGRDIRAMFRAEYVATVDPDLCTGCRECSRVCPFGTVAWSQANERSSVDQRHCWGCGVCRSVCVPGAVTLVPRAEVPAAARVW